MPVAIPPLPIPIPIPMSQPPTHHPASPIKQSKVTPCCRELNCAFFTKDARHCLTLQGSAYPEWLSLQTGHLWSSWSVSQAAWRGRSNLFWKDAGHHRRPPPLDTTPQFLICQELAQSLFTPPTHPFQFTHLKLTFFCCKFYTDLSVLRSCFELPLEEHLSCIFCGNCCCYLDLHLFSQHLTSCPSIRTESSVRKA